MALDITRVSTTIEILVHHDLSGKGPWQKLPALQCDHYERSHVDSVPHGEVAVALQGPDEQDQEGFVHDELAQHSESLFFTLQFWSVPLQDRMIGDLRIERINVVKVLQCCSANSNMQQADLMPSRSVQKKD